MADTKFSRALTAGDRKTWTTSVWVKRGLIGEACVWSGYTTAGSEWLLSRFMSNGEFAVREYTGSTQFELKSYADYKDVNGWYHVVNTCDTTESVAADRFKIFINGVQLSSFETESYPSLDYNTRMNVSGCTMAIGCDDVDTNDFEGYMAQFTYSDGTAYDATTFGSFDDTTGEWKPKSDGEIRTAVTFGTNGFLLPFSNASYPGYDYQTADRSGTTNDYTKSGSGYQAQDNPSNNFVTLNNNYSATGQYSTPGHTTTYANLAGYPGAGNNGFPANMGASKGKWYWESRPVNSSTMTGIMSGSASALGVWDGSYASGFTSYGGNKAIMYGTESGGGYLMGVTTSTAAFGTILNNSTDVVGCAMDLDNNNLYLSVNGTWQNSGVPTSGATGTGAVAITVQSGFPALGKEVWFPAMHTFSTSRTVEFNFGQGYFGTTSVGATNADDAGFGVFKYDVPAGYYALCTKNLKTYG